MNRELPSPQGAIPTGDSVNRVAEAANQLQQFSGITRTTRGVLSLRPRRIPKGAITDFPFRISVAGTKIVVALGTYFSLWSTSLSTDSWTTQEDDFDDSVTGWSGQIVPDSGSLYFYLKRTKAESGGLVTSSTVTAGTDTTVAAITALNADNVKVWIIGVVRSDKTFENFRYSDINETLTAKTTTAFPFVGATVLFPDYTPDTPNIPTGWELWSLATGRVVVGVGTYGAVEYTMAQAGGYIWHGETVDDQNPDHPDVANNHPKHDLKHHHKLTATCSNTGGGPIMVVPSNSDTDDSTTHWNGTSNLPFTEIPDSDIAHHKGPFNAGCVDTDNRQPFVVSAWIRYTG